jgi:hypothetical protein
LKYLIPRYDEYHRDGDDEDGEVFDIPVHGSFPNMLRVAGVHEEPEA